MSGTLFRIYIGERNAYELIYFNNNQLSTKAPKTITYIEDDGELMPDISALIYYG